MSRCPPGARSEDGSSAQRAAEAVAVPFSRPPRLLLPNLRLLPPGGSPLHCCWLLVGFSHAGTEEETGNRLYLLIKSKH